MNKTTKPTTIILSGFSVIVLLVTLSLSISLYQLSITQDVLQNGISQETSHALHANTLRSIASKRSALIGKILHTRDDFIKDDLIQEFYIQGQEFMKERAILMDGNLDTYELHLINEHVKHAQIVVPTQHEVIETSINGSYKDANDLFMLKAYPLQQKNNELLDNLANYQNNEIMARTAVLADQLKQTFLVIFLAGLFIIIFCIFAAVFIYKRLTNNITAIQNTKEKLTKSLTDLKNIKFALDQHAIVSVTDTAGNITSVNEKFCEVSQYSEDELIGKQHSIINSGFHKKSLFRDMWTTISSGKTWQGEIRNQKKDGSYYWVESSIVPFLDKNNLPYQYIAIRTEITHIKEIEEYLKQSLEQLVVEAEKAQLSNTLKDSIISTLTHELRTPLNIILGFTQLLQFDDKNFSKTQVDNIQCIESAGKELLNNIDVIMLYNKLKSQSLILQYSETELDQIFNTILNEIKTNNTDNKVLPTIKSTNEIIVNADIGLLKKALSYVIDNAIKFTQHGHIDIYFEEIDKNSDLPDHLLPAASNLILITIEDTGIGISKENIQIIFDEFRQADEKTDRKFDGIGIGLPLTKSIIEQHKGEVWLSSEVSKGTKVYITIPNLPVQNS